MIYANWIFLLLYVFILVTTVLTVLLDNKQPAKTVTWILVLLFIPVAGFVIYFFFGQNTRKMRLIGRRSLDQITRRSMLEFAGQKDLHLPERYKTLINMFANSGTALPFKDNDIDIYTDGYEYFLSLLCEIGRARHHIHVDVYIINDDPLGRLVADALIDKARQGVEVRFIYDDVGCWDVPDSFFERMQDNGIDVYPFMPVKFPAFTSKVNYRNHRKLCVIDGVVAFVGGMNIALRYVKGKTPDRSWRDTHLRVRGGVVYAVQCAFLLDWYFVARILISDRKYYPDSYKSAGTGCLAQVVTSSPVAPWPDIMQGYVRIFLEAKHYVYMESPYFLPTEPVVLAMRNAAVAGVDVRLIIPKHSDSRVMEWASMPYVVEAVGAGVEVFLYKPGFNHSKLLVCDDYLCTCGSTNIDFRSFENNFESNLFMYGEDVARRMKQVFMDDLQQCEQFDRTAYSARRPFLRRLAESLVRLVSPLL